MYRTQNLFLFFSLLSLYPLKNNSETEPQFIHLTYKSDDNNTTPRKKVAAIGKGLLFDTGGYNIKTAMMELMKFDCGT